MHESDRLKLDERLIQDMNEYYHRTGGDLAKDIRRIMGDIGLKHTQPLLEELHEIMLAESKLVVLSKELQDKGEEKLSKRLYLVYKQIAMSRDRIQQEINILEAELWKS